MADTRHVARSKETPLSLRPKRPWTTARHTTQIRLTRIGSSETSPVSCLGSVHPRRSREVSPPTGDTSGSASTISIRYVPQSRSLLAAAAAAAAIRYTPHGKMHAMCTTHNQRQRRDSCRSRRCNPSLVIVPPRNLGRLPSAAGARAETALSHALDPLLRPRRLQRGRSTIAGQLVAAPRFAAPRLPCL